MTTGSSSEKRTKAAVVGLALAVVFFLSLNVFSGLSLRSIQLDLTENRLFTLSGGTREILGSLVEPVTLRLYVSEHLTEASPYLATYATRVRDLLEAYARLTGDKLRLEVISPRPYSAEEDRAVGFGLQGIAFEAGGDPGYFGLAGTNSTDDVDVIPLFSPEREQFLEYDLTRLVYNLARPEKPVVALMSGLPMSGDPRRQFTPWEVVGQMRQFFDVQILGGEVDVIDPGVEVLMVVHPKEFAEKTLKAIDQFVLGGGKALIFVDPHSEADASGRAAQGLPPSMGTESAMDDLFAAWGIEMVPAKIVGDGRAARTVSFPEGGRDHVIKYLAWLSLKSDSLNTADVVTDELNVINVGTAGMLRPLDGAETTLAPLISTSVESMPIDVGKVRSFPNPLQLLSDFRAAGEGYVIAARVTGPAKTAYGEGKDEKAGDDADQGEDEAAAEELAALHGREDVGADDPHFFLTESRGPINVIVVADTDLLSDNTWLRLGNFLGQSVALPVADNANFVVNALDNLTGSGALISLRGRDVSARPFTTVQDIRLQAETRYRATEQQLVQKLRDLETKIRQLEVTEGPDGATILLSDAQRKEIEAARAEMIDVRRQLRDVQFKLRQDIESQETRIKFFNIAAVPILVAVLAVVLAGVKRARFRRHYMTSHE